MDGLALPLPQHAMARLQRTLKSAIGCVGVGLHSGRRVSLTLLPADPGQGVVFRRTDLGIDIPARFDSVADTRLCTVLTVPPGEDGRPCARVGTVEHVMAALAACGIDNAVVAVDGPEVPALDGSAAPFVFLIDCAGVREQPVPVSVIEVLRPVRVEHGEAFAELRPNPDEGFDLDLGIAFEAAAIGRQSLALRVTERTFRRDLARARTFALKSEITALRKAGLARGGSLSNAVVVDGARVLNPGGLRMAGEFVRHKALDAVGDIALAGGPVRARFTGSRSGHALNNRLLRALFADASAWRRVTPLAGPDLAPLSLAAA